MVALKPGLGFFKVFGISLIVIIFLIIFSNAIIASVQQKSIQPFLSEVGQRILLASNNLEMQSRLISTQAVTNDASQGPLQSIWLVIRKASGLLGALMVVFGWMKLLDLIWRKTPWGHESFNHYSLTLISYWLIQFIVLVVNASISGTPVGLSGGANSVTAFALEPLTAFIKFFKALAVVLSPVANAAGKIENATGS